MNEAQVLGFADGNTSIPISWMTSNGLFLGIAFNGWAMFESTTSSTAPYQVSIRLDGTEIAISPVITSGAAAGVSVPNSFENDTGTFTAHIISDSNITFQSLKWKLSLYLQPNYLVPAELVEAEYTSTNLSYTPNGSTEVSSTGNYRQQTTGSLGSTTSCPTCTTYITAILLSATPSAPNNANCSEGNIGTLENRVYVLYTAAWFTTNAAGKNVVLSAFSLTDNEIINSSDSAYTIHPDSITTASTTVFRNSSDGNYMIRDNSTQGTAKLLFRKDGVYGTTVTCGSAVTPPPTPTQYQMSNSTGTISSACAIESYPISIYANNNSFVNGAIVYTNSTLNTPYAGDETYYKLNKDGGKVLQIDSGGEIMVAPDFCSFLPPE